MNKNDECQIIEDLLYAYNETMLNQKSNEFVNEHLKNCENCKDKLESIRSNIFVEKSKEAQEDKIELKHLLKINRVMRGLKISLVILILIILLFLGSVLFKSNRSEYVVNNAYSKLEELRKEDNYKITKRVKYVSSGEERTEDVTSTLYYKNGKYKEVIPGSIFFYNDDSNEIIYVFEDLKSIEKSRKGIIAHKGYYFLEDTGVRSIYNNEKSIFQKAIYEIRSDNFNGIDCYVITRKRSNNEYYEIWLNKENFINLRVVENCEAYYRETTYDIIINETLDSDVTLNMDEYKEYTLKDLTTNTEYRDVMIYND